MNDDGSPPPSIILHTLVSHCQNSSQRNSGTVVGCGWLLPLKLSLNLTAPPLPSEYRHKTKTWGSELRTEESDNLGVDDSAPIPQNSIGGIDIYEATTNNPKTRTRNVAAMLTTRRTTPQH